MPSVVILARELARLEEQFGRRVSLGEFSAESLIDPADIYRRGSWIDPRRCAGVEVEPGRASRGGALPRPPAASSFKIVKAAAS